MQIIAETACAGLPPEIETNLREAPGDRDSLIAMAALAGLVRAPLVAPVKFGITSLPARDGGAEHLAGLALTKPDRRVRGDPLVSILIPAYTPSFFAACLDSALAQTHRNVEIVICDDSRGPEIEDIVRAHARGGEIRYLRNEIRLGPRGNFTRCIELARGEFIKFLCDDDLLAPTCIAALLDAFRRAPDITLATSRRQRIDGNGSPLADIPATTPIVDENAVIAGYALANAMIVAGLNTIGEPSTVLFRKSDLLDQAPEYFRFAGVAGHGIIDMVTWSALLLKGDAAYLCGRESAFRSHPGQRQHDPAKLERNVASIRSLQAAWLALGVHEWQRPDQLLAKPFPAGPDSDWRQRSMGGYPARPISEAGGKRGTS